MRVFVYITYKTQYSRHQNRLIAQSGYQTMTLITVINV